MVSEVHTSVGKFRIERVTELPLILMVRGTAKWDFLREAIAEMRNKDDIRKVNCPNKKQASLAQSAIGNYHQRAGRGQTLPKGCKLRSRSNLLKDGTVDVYVYFATA